MRQALHFKEIGLSIASNNAAAERVKIVAECWPCTIVDNQHRRELLANARLISAAPDLLAACESAKLELNCLIEQAAARGYTSGGPKRVVAEIDAALAKAVPNA